MVDFTGPQVKVEKKKGTVNYSDRNRTMELVHGEPLLREAAEVIIHNTHPEGKYLMIDLFNKWGIIKTEAAGKIKINPGKNRKLAAQTEIAAPNLILTHGTFYTEDPDPAEAGGKSGWGRAWSETVEATRGALPWIAGLSIVGGLTYIAVKKRSTIKKIVRR